MSLKGLGALELDRNLKNLRRRPEVKSNGSPKRRNPFHMGVAPPPDFEPESDESVHSPPPKGIRSPKIFKKNLRMR